MSFGSNPIIRLCMKLRKLKMQLKELNKKQYSGISRRVQQKKEQLDEVQRQIGCDPQNIELVET